MKVTIALIIGVFAVVLISGCINLPDNPQLFCGDGSCSGSESCGSCPQDCGQCQIDPVEITGIGAYWEQDYGVPDWLGVNRCQVDRANFLFGCSTNYGTEPYCSLLLSDIAARITYDQGQVICDGEFHQSTYSQPVNRNYDLYLQCNYMSTADTEGTFLLMNCV